MKFDVHPLKNNVCILIFNTNNARIILQIYVKF